MHSTHPLALSNPDRKDAVLRGAGGSTLTPDYFKLLRVCPPYPVPRPGEPTSGGDAGDAVTSPSYKQLLNVLTCT